MKKSKLLDPQRELEAVEALKLVRHGDQASEPEVLKTDIGLTWKSALPGLGLIGALGAVSAYGMRRRGKNKNL